MDISTARTIKLMTGTATFAFALTSLPAWAQANTQSAEQHATSGGPETTSSEDSKDIIVTGSRIRRAATDTTVPIAVVSAQSIADRGFVSAAQALNTQPSINRQLAQAPGNGSTSGSGIQAPSLFGLGTGRTLTLVNGRRTATTSSGLGDSQVDANTIPLGLLDRVEVVQGGAAAVYGSDAIAGVVNYVLRRDFQGVEADAQYGVTERGDYPTRSARLTAGTNFGGGRGNIAANVEWSDTAPLAFASRPRTQLSRVSVPNPANTGPADGIPSRREALDAALWELNTGGVVFTEDAPFAGFLLNRQFASDGSVVPFDAGTRFGVPFAIGGDGMRYSRLVDTLRTGTERITGNVIGHYDLTDNITLSTELLYSHVVGSEGLYTRLSSVLGGSTPADGSIAFTIDNPFLTPSAIATLSEASPDFAGGAPLYLSKAWVDLVRDNKRTSTTDTYRGLLALDGKFEVGGHAFDWSISGSYARVDGSERSWGVDVLRYQNAIASTRNATGQIVCAINIDAISTNDDPNCSPLNPFGEGNVSAGARNYISGRSGSNYRNEQVDLLATINGSLLRLPGGEAKASLTYEHRDERARFTPLAADQAGQFGFTGVTPQAGRYNTDEFAGEILIPLVGNDFTLPLVHALEVSGAYRYVDNSIAGTENVWNIGARWQPVPGITFRASRSRNFRAPSLTQLFAPSVTSVDGGYDDPCDADSIAAGPNPAQRGAACLALFQANPTYGTGGPGGAPVGAPAAERLAGFQNSGDNFATMLVTAGGNPNLRNETAKTWTYGVVLQPRFIPGLTLTADRIEIDLTDGLSAFDTGNFAEACYDDPNPPAGVCDAFTRLTTATATSQAGSYATGTTTTFNAGIIRYRGETYNINYVLPLGGDSGTFEFDVAATHTALLESSVTGTVFTRSDNTANSPITGTEQPDWVGRFDLSYTKGPFRFTYQAFYMSPVLAAPDATIENNPNPNLASNTTHSISAQVDLGRVALRFGINNLTDKQPSYPSISYGDIIGRSYYVGAKVRF